MRLQTKIILTVVAIVIILNTIFYSINIYNQKIDSYARLITKIEKNGDILNTISSVALYNFQRPILEANLESFFRDPELCSIELVDKVGAINLKYMKCDPRGYNTITKQTSLFYEGDYLGEIITIYITDIIDKNTSKAIINLLISMFIITIILSIILFLLIRIIVKPINELTILSLEISEGNLDKDININSRDEIGTLTKSFIKMRDSIKEKNRDLEKNKEELEELVFKRTSDLQGTLDRLKETQEDLVESEKMASLGELVAGVAHEINTPIGIGVTAASHLVDEAEEVHQLLEINELKKSQFIKYVANSILTSHMILKNLTRAAGLVKSFKMVAVDQSSEEIRTFNINQYIKEILSNTNTKFKHTNFIVKLEHSEDFSLNSYPGALSQIITNLLLNSLKHGFDNLESGEITIITKREGNLASIIYKDDGNGIPDNIIDKIFDPFFTTKRGEGGSGLGLSIIYNLVTQKLQGSITCTSSLGDGTQFSLKFPCNIINPKIF